MLQLVTVFLVSSGVASLTYQVTWVRLLGLSIGSTSASISTVLAALTIRVVELEPAVVEAVLRAIYDGHIPAMQDQRVRIEFNDARNTLLVEQRTYDLIVSQPSHPWRAGR